MREHPESVNLRYLAPPLAVLGFVGGLIAGIFWWPAFALPVGYLVLVVAGAQVIGAGLPWRARFVLPAVLATMHGAWGSGFLSSISLRRSAGRR